MKFLLFILSIVYVTNVKGQTISFNKSFTKTQTKLWLLNTLNKTVLKEADMGQKPVFQFEDTALIISMPSQKRFDGIPITESLIFSYTQIFIMNTYSTDKNGNDRIEYLSINSDKLSIDFILNKQVVTLTNKPSFINNLRNAFYILADKRELID